MIKIIPDPDFADFNGVYAGGIDVEPPKEKYNYTDLTNYMKKLDKSFQELTIEEIEQFRTDKFIEELPNCDNFVVGNKDQKEFVPFGYRIPDVCAYMKETGKKFEELTEEELAKFKTDRPKAYTLELIKELRCSGVGKCPLCNKGDFIARKDIQIEKQYIFQCNNCKEKLILHIKSE